jgi:hypothetical protein
MNSLRRRGQEKFRQWINEPALGFSNHGSMLIKILRVKRRETCQTWINDWQSDNHS